MMCSPGSSTAIRAAASRMLLVFAAMALTWSALALASGRPVTQGIIGRAEAAIQAPTQLSVTPTTARYFRQGARLSGLLGDADNNPVAEATLVVQRRSGPGWYPVSLLTTSASGRYSMPLDHLRDGRYRVVFAGMTATVSGDSYVFGASRSGTVTVKVKSPKLNLSSTRIASGKALRVSGTVPKSASAKRVRLRELVDDSWVSRGTLKLNSRRAFSYAFKPSLGAHHYSIVTIPTKSTVKRLASSGRVVSVYRKKRLKSMSKMIAHGGGVVGNITYTNSMNALEENYARGHRLFELDFQWTTDGRLVALHDWNETLTKLFVVPGGRTSYNRFMSLSMVQGHEQMDIETVADWLREHPKATVVTDIKDRNVEAMRYISEHMPDVMHRFAIQCKNSRDLKTARALGFSNYFLTMYNWKSTNNVAVALGKKYKPIAVSIPYDKAMKTNLPTRFKSLGIRSYAHTLNDGTKLGLLNTRGVYGIFTDYLRP